MDTNALYIIAGVVAAVVCLIVTVKYLKNNKGFDVSLAENIDQGADKAIEVIESFLKVVDLGDKTEKSIQSILDLVDKVTDHVAKTVKDDADKAAISLATVNEILAILDVETTENEDNLIEIVISESLRWIDKK